MLPTFPLQLTFSGRPNEPLATSQGSRLPPKPNTKTQPWDLLHSAVIDDPSNLSKWDELLAVLTSCWEASEKTDSTINSAIVDLFEALLSLYPFLTAYWRQYLQLKLRMGTQGDYIRCLKSAVDSFPQSVPLWTEYMRALMEENSKTQNGDEGKSDKKGETNEKDAKDPKDVNTINTSSGKDNVAVGYPLSSGALREEFKRGAAAVGRNFNSETFWDAYIEFESSLSSDSPELLDLYLQLVTIPLYLYAHFYNKFIEAIKAYPIENVIKDEKILSKQLEGFGKTLAGDLSAEETLILDAFTYEIFNETQRKVNESWTFESEIQIHDYLPVATPALETQYRKYMEYINHEISALDAMEDSDAKRKLQISQIIITFERALVPHCHEPDLWQKYTAFLQTAEAPIEEVKRAYERAIFLFAPIGAHALRDDFIKYLLGRDEFDLANQTLLKTLKLFSGTSGRLMYMKNAYVHDMRALMRLWSERAAINVDLVLEGLVTGYFDRVDRYKKEHASENGRKKAEGHVIDQSIISALSKVVNDDGICIILVSFLRFLLKDDENTARIRKLYNKYYKETVLGRSVLFWNFFVDYEGMKKKNLTNLNMIIEYVKMQSGLPKRAVDAFVEIQYELTCANLTRAVALHKNDRLLKPLVSAHYERSNDLFVNSAARSRQANIAIVLDHKSGGSKEQAYVNGMKKQLGHPGVVAEFVPEITNLWMEKEWVSLLDDQAVPPPLPAFRHIDRANAPLIHNDM